MANLYEYYNTGDDAGVGVYGAVWVAQTFTPALAHKITSVKVKLGNRVGSPGTVTVSVQATGVGGPSGTDLCSGTIDGNSITSDAAGAWYEITLGAGYNLTAGVIYAIVIKAPAGNASNYFNGRYDNSSPTYAGGNMYYTNNGGVSWTAYANFDCMFEDWGVELAQPMCRGFVVG